MCDSCQAITFLDQVLQKRSGMYAGTFCTPLSINHHLGDIPKSTRGVTRVLCLHVADVSNAARVIRKWNMSHWLHTYQTEWCEKALVHFY